MYDIDGRPASQLQNGAFLRATRSILRISYGNVSVYRSVCLSVMSVTAGIVSKRLNLS